MCARFTQTDASENCLANFEIFADQVIKGYTAGRDVAAAFRALEVEIVIFGKSLESFWFDKRGFARLVVFVGVGSGTVVVSVAFQAHPFDGFNIIYGSQFVSSVRCNLNGNYGT